MCVRYLENTLAQSKCYTGCYCYHLKKKRRAERVMEASITEPPLFHEQQEDQRSRPHPSLPPKDTPLQKSSCGYCPELAPFTSATDLGADSPATAGRSDTQLGAPRAYNLLQSK